jgi:F0F1-type ATP synthase assembly protein I
MEDQPHQRKRKLKNLQSKGIRDFAKYSGMAFQMIGIILAATWGGTKLDAILRFETPVFTIILSLLGVFAALYVVLRDFIK